MADGDRERWNRRYLAGLDRPVGAPAPSSFLCSVADQLPSSGRALDVAGGSGRNGIWLAGRGLDVTVADVSDVGLERARQGAERAGVGLDVRVWDAESDPFPPGPWSLICNVNFLVRALIPRYLANLAPGGWLVLCHPTKTNLERHAKPSARFLLEPGELADLVVGFDVVSLEEGWQESGRHESRLLARRPTR